MTILITAEKQSENLSENPPYYLEEKKMEKKNTSHLYSVHYFRKYVSVCVDWDELSLLVSANFIKERLETKCLYSICLEILHSMLSFFFSM